MDHPKVVLLVIKFFIGTYEYFIVEKKQQLVWLKSQMKAGSVMTLFLLICVSKGVNF